VVWISGDTVLYDGVRTVTDRLTVSLAVLHLGEARFPVTGPVRYTITAADGIELCRAVRPRTVVPVHYEGWSHFRQGRTAIEQTLAAAPDVRDSFQQVQIGVGHDLDI
jgi:L-ascorbate metabolism protein UlaG (beta-lactamase superfamily)